eukprot:Sdes_comp22967_c0_seq1m21318
MRPTFVKYGGQWGELLAHNYGLSSKARGLVTYTLSPFETRSFAGFFSKAPYNALRRISTSFWDVFPGFICIYSVYAWAEAEHERLSRKQPGQFDNEVIETS